jgi:hypothetical protein
MQIFRMRRIGHVYDRSPAVFGLPGQRIDGLRHVAGAAVMSDIGDPPIALMKDGGLVGAAVLQVVVPGEPHVAGFGRRADFLALRRTGNHEAKQAQKHNTHTSEGKKPRHDDLPLAKSTLHYAPACG